MSELSPFSIERVAEYLKSQGYNFTTDDDGDIYTGFEENSFMLLATGAKREIFAIRGAWKITSPIEGRAPLIEFCNEWNRTKLWPKTYVTVNDDGVVGVQAELNTDLEHGATDVQIQQFFHCGIATTLQFFNELTNQFVVPTDSESEVELHFDIPRDETDKN
ncbi:MAG: YbjN domain-containing protein [Corynebacterium sp.]|uniref:YbjN domain-containing protein n=1 Tax=Corynebacterium sp. TaxID=1720 RepID=UPI0026DB63B4|nr:YbjN domain-containing protein [Corynebacterium sp.]MDO4760630.1 YbjN domain-containing protein [Corynebacterium sp.]